MNRWPQKHESKQLGCTCQWYRGGAIARFDAGCPILHRHRRGQA